MRMHPLMRAMDLANMVWWASGFRGQGDYVAIDPQLLNPGGWAVNKTCTAGDVVIAQYPSHNLPMPCGTFVAIPGQLSETALQVWFFGKQDVGPPYTPLVHSVSRFSLVRPRRPGTTRPDMTSPSPYLTPGYAVGLSPLLDPQFGRPVPHALVPYLQDSPAGFPGRSTSYGGPSGYGGATRGWWPGRHLGPRPSENPHRPPPRRTKEAKAKVTSGMARLAKAAFEITEIDDLLDVMVKALPADIQKKVGKSGRVSATGFRPGAPYTNMQDKMRLIYRHLDKIDMEAFVIEWVKNYIEDAILGRAFGKADKQARSMRVNGIGLSLS